MNIWGKSAKCYDAFSTLVPYQDMVGQIAYMVSTRPKDVVLDLGCGTCNLEVDLAQTQHTLIALDMSPEMLAEAKGKVNSSVNFLLADLNNPLPISNETVGIVTSIHSLYLVGDMKSQLSEIWRVLRSEGTLILVHPKPKGMGGFIAAHFGSFRFGMIVRSILQLPRLVTLFKSGAKVERTVQMNFLSEEDLREMLDQTGFSIEECKAIYGGISTLVVARK